MGDSSGRIDVEKLVPFSDDLIAVLKDKRDSNSLIQCLEQSKSLNSSCDAEFSDSKALIEDYEKKIEECKKKTEKATSEVVSDAEMEVLHKELEAELEKELVNNEINGLKRQRISFEVKKQNLKKDEKDELRAHLKLIDCRHLCAPSQLGISNLVTCVLWLLSMYASLTNIIPDLDDHSGISGRPILFGNHGRLLVLNIEHLGDDKSAIDVGHLQLAWLILLGSNAYREDPVSLLFYSLSVEAIFSRREEKKTDPLIRSPCCLSTTGIHPPGEFLV
ncbi:unnamed protein product [Dovyalis caffra]|uniref:FRIGIDA-like protein n=1 Tax=Dovyalis caffra TaxID=77055 RepID=A0AAV1S0I4_9ROSI|nr:unnamed protein product [Dovyalis caffra]